MRLRSIARHFLKDLPRQLAWQRTVARKRRAAERELSARWAAPRLQNSHGLGRELVVSLTSYDRRFPTLANTLKCLITQSVRPDRVILWVSVEDALVLPPDVQALIGQGGLEVRTAWNMGPYTKVIPALTAFPDAYIATADDDTYYGPDWLERMVRAVRADERQIVCHRAHGLRTLPSGEIAPYAEWDYEANAFADTVIFPTGVGGVLYSPGALAEPVLDRGLFETLSPRNDDVWLAWLGHRAGSRYTKLFNVETPITWKSSQEVGLLKTNVEGAGNDGQIQKMREHFGPIHAAAYEVVPA